MGFGELPFSVFFFFTYSKLSNMTNTEKLCRYSMFTFLTILTVLPFLFFKFDHNNYPILTKFPRVKGASKLNNLKWLLKLIVIKLLIKLPYIIYFILGELWPVIAYSVLFWQFMNKFNNPEESKKQYISYNLYGQ